MVKMECRLASALRFGQGGQRGTHKSSTIKILPQASCKQNLSFFLIRLILLNSYQQIVLATSVAISIAETILYTASQTTTWPLLTQLQKYTISSPPQYTPLTLHATNYKLSPTIWFYKKKKKHPGVLIHFRRRHKVSSSCVCMLNWTNTFQLLSMNAFYNQQMDMYKGLDW